jgi:bis(5'-nucleosidyl)-tetraphosphatase
MFTGLQCQEHIQEKAKPVKNEDLTPTKTGVVVLRRFNDAWRCLLLRAYRNWDFPKGNRRRRNAMLRHAGGGGNGDSTRISLGRYFPRHRTVRRWQGCALLLGRVAGRQRRTSVSAELRRPEHHEFRWVDFHAAKTSFHRAAAHLAWAEKSAALRTLIGRHPIGATFSAPT